MSEYIFDCPKCKCTKVGHELRYLIDSYQFTPNNIYKIDDGEFSFYKSFLNNSSLRFNEGKVVHEIICNNCQYKRLVFLNDEGNDVEKTIYPILPEGKPLPDCMTEDLRKDFDEARLIVNYSVRCAVGLLRICGEKLCNFIADKYITNEDVKKEIIEKQNKLQPKIDLLVKYRKNYFPFIDEECIKNLEVGKDAGNNSLHSREISDEYTKEDFNTLCTIIAAICDAIATKEENDKRINALKQKNDNNEKNKNTKIAKKNLMT